MAGAALHDQHFVFLEQRAIRFENFVENRDLGSFAGGAVVEHHDQHLAALRHLGALAYDHAGHGLVARIAVAVAAPVALVGHFARQIGQRRARKAAHLVTVFIKQVAGKVETQRLLFLLQLALGRPGRLVDEFGTMLLGVVAAHQVEERHLVGGRRLLLGGFHGQADRREQLRAVVVEAVEGAGPHQRLDRPAIDLATVNTLAEIEQVLEWAVFACTQNVLDRALATALHAAQAVADGLGVGRCKTVLAGVDIRRQDGQAVLASGIVVKDLHLVGVVHGERHVGCHEFGRMMRLEPSRVVRQQRIRGRVRLVETVAGELLHQVEDFIGLFGGEPVLGRTRPEQRAVLGHFFGLLLTHRTAQQVGAAERVTAHDLRHLHHLLLVDHDAVGLLEHRLDARVGVLHLFAAVLTCAEAGDQVHRARAIQRHEGDDVLKAVRLGVLQHALHAAAFQLEHGHRVGRLQDVERLLVRQRNMAAVPIRLGRIEHADVALGPVEDRERGQAQEVELDQANGFHIVLVVLADDAGVFPALRVERAEVGQLARSDQHAASVHADVTRHAFDALRKFQQLLDFFFVGLALGQQRLFLLRFFERNELARLERNQLGDPVNEVVAEIEHAANVAHRGLGGHGAEGGDLRDGVLAVLFFHVLDDAVTAVLAEVDVEVGHRHTFRIQETLEQQVVFERVQIGNTQRVRHQRAGARTPARPHWHAIVLRPVDEVRNDEEIAGEAHLDDGAGLELQAGVVLSALGFAHRLVGEKHFHALFQTFLGELNEVVVQRHAVGRREQRQLGLAQFQLEVAALRDLHRIGQRGRDVGKQRAHLVLRLEILFGREAAGPARIGEQFTLCDTGACLVGREIVRRHELHRVCGDYRQLHGRCKLHRLLDVGLSTGVPRAL